MGYRDDFYTVDNIVGYTGDINNNPTVYFEMEKDGKLEVGHITQKHGNPKNEGREKVKEEKNYQHFNAWVAEKDDKLFILKECEIKEEKDVKVPPGLGSDYKEVVLKDGTKMDFEFSSVERSATGHHVSRSPFVKIKKRSEEHKKLISAIGNKQQRKEFDPDKEALKRYREKHKGEKIDENDIFKILDENPAINTPNTSDVENTQKTIPKDQQLKKPKSPSKINTEVLANLASDKTVKQLMKRRNNPKTNITQDDLAALSSTTSKKAKPVRTSRTSDPKPNGNNSTKTMRL